MDQTEVDILVDVCPGQIHVRPPCWVNREKRRSYNFCRFKTKRRKLRFKEILFLAKSMKTYLSKKIWF